MDSSRSEKSSSKRNSKKIEDDLFSRHKTLLRKIDVLKTKKINEQLKNNQQTPVINSVSKRLASKNDKQRQIIYSPTKVQRTQEILQNSRFMPKKIRLSLENLKLIANNCKTSTMKVCRYDVALTAPKPDSPVTFPSLQMPLTIRDPENSNDLPPDITQRNEILYSLRNKSSNLTTEKSTSQPNYGNLSITERSALWLQRKQEKIRLLRDKKDTKATSGCTFRPHLNNTMRPSSKSTKRSLSSQSLYSQTNIKKPMRKISVNSFAKSERAASVNCKNSTPLETIKNHRNASLNNLVLYAL
ncbi:hypothetical protein SteCoe_6446 [Stentor coeruleus]|uniref:Uncharacterized protein n=1 Tax=Stentor coeruleus TaxID=5963 RepID=A0A1R2CQ05_9CILI|nr:hypothetical protein SteCoe_6446 [Stentor coeruleus]